MKRIIIGLFSGLLITSVFADAPVVDYSVKAAQTFPMPTSETSKISPQTPITTNLNTEQRVSRVEQQVANLNNQNYAQKVEELQQNVQSLNGKLELQAHQIEELSKQLNNYYQDLNQRIGGGGSVKPIVTYEATPVSTIVPATNTTIAGAFNNPPPAPDVKNASTALKEQQVYQTAIDLLPDKKSEATIKLREYLKQYPKGAHAADAHYWLGEINFGQNNFDAAEEEFKQVEKYPESKKAIKAKFKLAIVHQNQGRAAQAKQELQKIIKLYPNTNDAELAKQQLGVSK